MVLSPVYICDLVCIFNLCVYVCVCLFYSRTIAHVELMFLLIKPTLNKFYFTLLYFTSAGIFSIGPLGINFSEILI